MLTTGDCRLVTGTYVRSRHDATFHDHCDENSSSLRHFEASAVMVCGGSAIDQ